ncbi:hypothetical protein [Hansschlegelia zhihuaiae]|uniref:Uncharacterized protein n=1 Tax=Hansschlegelia zhihuaiae TaxID=405005 RepID=A0A4Q0MGK8_9HYPH|nr:hypothetical protein [Hansschlegelia zhihuaiae]RXF72086.1 hypothetical protein EK403_14855 [Hansschlegelia zhihuaiae]
MRCEPCAGTGRVMIPATPIRVAQGVVGVASWLVCDECRGIGVVSCCEGTERHAGVAGYFGGKELGGERQPSGETGMERAS